MPPPLEKAHLAHFQVPGIGAAEHLVFASEYEAADPEIAAHWGEVLWAKGQQQKAKDIWQSQLKTTPDHPLLLETVRRHSR